MNLTNTIDEMFNDPSEWHSFCDCVYEVNGQSLSSDKLRIVFDSLPNNIQSIAYAWGLSDSVFRDEVSVFLRKENEE
jgi:hypothetical protein|tara:strand:- start:636 stop:866 length:231 start_codon:yes stop_codon:yes gene_type:complete